MSIDQEKLQLAKKVLDVLLKTERKDGFYDHMNMDNWEWPVGVALYCMFKIYKKTGDLDFYNALTDWYDKQLQKEPPHRNVNTVAPMLTMVCLYEENKNPVYLEHIESWINWVMNEMPRTEYGGMQHMTVWNRHNQQLWDDTLFMTVLFLAKAGKVLDRPQLVDEAKYQFLFHIKYLQDKRTGLFYHGWTFDCRHNFANAFWARGNSWFTSGAVEFIDIVGERDATTRFVEVAWKDQVKALIKYQSINGLYNTLVDVEESYWETSATAGIAYGLLKGIRMGLLDKENEFYAMNAANAVLAKIQDDGIVAGVSYGTGMGKDFDFYKNIKICPTAYGQGLVLLMLTELI